MQRSILYFDADAACLKLFRDALCAEHDLRTQATLAAARRALSERAAEIVISEQNLPELRGTDFLREVAAAHPDSFRVLLTDSAGVGEAISEVSCGVIHILIPKPLTVGKIREVIELAELQFRLRMKDRKRRAG